MDTSIDCIVCILYVELILGLVYSSLLYSKNLKTRTVLYREGNFLSKVIIRFSVAICQKNVWFELKKILKYYRGRLDDIKHNAMTGALKKM